MASGSPRTILIALGEHDAIDRVGELPGNDLGGVLLGNECRQIFWPVQCPELGDEAVASQRGEREGVGGQGGVKGERGGCHSGRFMHKLKPSSL